jgi:hypothetical protein
LCQVRSLFARSIFFFFFFFWSFSLSFSEAFVQMQKDAMAEGLELATQAVSEDGAGRVANAARLYEQAEQALARALASLPTSQTALANVVHAKIREYAQRRALLIASLQTPFNPSVPFPPAPEYVSSGYSSNNVQISVPAPSSSPTSINDILRLAFDVAQHARQEDAVGNTRGAFEVCVFVLVFVFG